MKEKKILRKAIRKQIANGAGRSEDLNFLASHLKNFADFSNKTVAVYQADEQELELIQFFSASHILLPRFNTKNKLYDFSLWSGQDEDLREGPYGILEPRQINELDQIDFCFIPGMAFDRLGNRLGRGGGFYDRLLAKYCIGTKVGVCYDFQLVGEVPKEDHDDKMDFILCPSGLFKCDRKN
jgi:5-formyltetrahydrofolate cyclo-ligase